MTTHVGYRDCVREEVARLSSGAFYDNPRDYLRKVGEILEEVGITFVVPFVGFYHDEGRAMQRLEHLGNELDTCLYFTWYRMGSGRWEMIGYLT